MHRASRGTIRAAKENLTRQQAAFLSKANRKDLFKRFRKVSETDEDPVPELVVNGEILTDKKEQTAAFNECFSQVGEERPEDSFESQFKTRIDEAIWTRLQTGS